MEDFGILLNSDMVKSDMCHARVKPDTGALKGYLRPA